MSSSESEADSEPKQHKKRNKHAPAEMSSKKAVSVLRNIPDGKPKTVDPRFSNAHGKLDHGRFFKDYGFLDQIYENEIKDMSKIQKKVKNSDKKDELHKEIAKRKQLLVEKRRAERVQDRIQDMYKKEHNKVQHGKNPFFLKKSEIKKITLEEKFNDLKKTGKLNKYMEKKRKRNASKDHLSLPSTRRARIEQE